MNVVTSLVPPSRMEILVHRVELEFTLNIRRDMVS